jgi:hypothetical protein
MCEVLGRKKLLRAFRFFQRSASEVGKCTEDK